MPPIANVKKDKAASALNGKVCGNCSALEGSASAPKLPACSRCGLVMYCSRECQRAHWKANHKQHCVAKADRAPQEQNLLVASKNDTPDAASTGGKCAICQGMLSGASTCTLPCAHAFHKTCVAELRKFGVQQVCPLCRIPLPPGAKKVYDEATRRFVAIQRQVNQGNTSWSALSPSMQQEMDEVATGWQEAADQGLPQAYFSLGFLNETGYGGAKNAPVAVRWYKKAVEAGVVIEAQLRLGFMTGEGRGTPQNATESARWFKEAADYGSADGQFYLGEAYRGGCGVEQSFDKAVKLCRKAAEQGHVEAQFNLGIMFEKGHGVKQSSVEAALWLKKAAGQGFTRAQLTLGIMFTEGRGVARSDVEAARWWKLAACAGDKKAQTYLGVMIEQGRGLSQSYTEACQWYKKAAEQGHAEAQCSLGCCYQFGRGVRQNYADAARWIRMAADQEGYAEAQHRMACLYQEGCGVEQSDVEAAKWFKKAAEQGYAGSQMTLGILLADGRGV